MFTEDVIPKPPCLIGSDIWETRASFNSTFNIADRHCENEASIFFNKSVLVKAGEVRRICSSFGIERHERRRKRASWEFNFFRRSEATPKELKKLFNDSSREFSPMAAPRRVTSCSGTTLMLGSSSLIC